MALPAGPRTAGFSRQDLLRWVYLGRLTVVSGIEVGALLRWLEAAPEQTFVATVVFLAAFIVTGLSFWYTHVLGRETGVNFAYGQVVFDVAMVTAIVHITGGITSFFAPLYILVITVGALLLPLPGGVLIGALASMSYFADITWGHNAALGIPVLFQILIFAGVALVTGWVGDRVRRAGMALGAVESELRQLRLDTADILGTISTGVVTVDGEGRLAYMNEAAETMLGISASQWIGAPVVGTVDEVAPGLGTLLRRSLADRMGMARYKTTAQSPRGPITLGVTTTVLEREGGGLPSVTAIFQDISDLDRLDELNRRNERLEALAELSASLAHEIKNPLASIRSAVEQLDRPGMEGRDRDTLRRLVLAESDRLSRLLSDFIEFSRLRIGRLEPVNLTGVLQDTAALVLQHPSCCPESRFHVDLDPDPIIVQGDADLLHRAFFNLILNGAQFAGPEGEVRVSAEVRREAVSDAGVEGPLVRVRVEDSGPGVDPGHLDRIFDPFVTTREGGSGLGLPVANRTVEAHGGAILVGRSDLGGACFMVDLPLNAVLEPLALQEESTG